VDTGFASPEKRNSQNEICPDYDARTSDGPGVFTSGDHTATQIPGTAPAALRYAAAVRAAVPL